MSNHTPGPWSYSTVLKHRLGAAGVPVLAELVLTHVSINEYEANRKLIAASPLMLEALISARTAMLKKGVGYDDADLYNVLDKAIKAATNP